MKPRTVYEKAVQDFTETARRLARLDQHFRQTSFAEFKMLMTFNGEILNGRAGAHRSVSNRRAWSAEIQGSLLIAVLLRPARQTAGACSVHGSDGQIFGADEQVPDGVLSD
jgi:hypothetical protein